MAGRNHMSIGDVLNELRDEFPEITISKIRFLESQGLVEPERTPSGYRKFYERDVERLRFILRHQREHFLPLKVIKDRLDELDRAGGPLPTGIVGEADGDGRDADRDAAREPALFEENRRRRAAAEAGAVAAAIVDEGGDDVTLADGGVSLTRAELARAAEISDAQLALLEEFGLLAPVHTTGDRALFDEDALTVARAAAAFMGYGVEPRHLRMYRAFADREAALFEQVLLPYRRRRNPEAQARSAETLAELAGLGRRLRTGLLRQAVRRDLGG